MNHDMDWALVADGRRARILQRRAPAGAWAELEEEAIEREDAPSREMGRDRPGRSQAAPGAARHAVDPRSDPHEAAEEAFAGELVERLAAAAKAGRFKRLALVAAPTFLGHLRAALPPALARAVLGTLDKDLTRHALKELVPHMDELRAP